MAVEIRDARPEDAAEIARLLGQLGYPTDAASVRHRLGRLGDDRLVVAETDCVVAGLRAHLLDDGGAQRECATFYQRLGLEYTGRRYAKRLPLEAQAAPTAPLASHSDDQRDRTAAPAPRVDLPLARTAPRS